MMILNSEEFRYCPVDWALVDVEDYVCPTHGVKTVPVKDEELFNELWNNVPVKEIKNNVREVRRMIDVSDKDLQGNWLTRPDIGKSVLFQIVADGTKIQKTSKKDKPYVVYRLRVLPKGELEPKDIEVIASSYKKMISDALGKDWQKAPNPSIVRHWFEMTCELVTDENNPDGLRTYPIKFVKETPK